MLAQQLVNGVLLGATYALFALGFTLMFGVLRVINLTYGFYFTAGAFVALFLTRDAGVGLWLALPAAALASGAVAVVLDALLLTRLRRARAEPRRRQPAYSDPREAERAPGGTPTRRSPLDGSWASSRGSRW